MRQCRAAGLAGLAAVLLVAVSRAQVQQEPSVETSEGIGINITCSHPNTQFSEVIQWYRQLPGRGPAFLVSAVKGSKEVPDPEGQLWVSADRRSSVLRLSRPRLGDAALYYCALGAREAKPGLRPGTNRLGRAGGAVPSGPAGGAAAPPSRPRRAGSADMERVPRTARHPPEKGVPAAHFHECWCHSHLHVISSVALF
ncbi:M1-specific T cell receptor alpha chain-like [Lagopus muta]|uniref:M1-specific T cell receptor alpha chain-like n=1 Tax=Lagopus muta TaxID=64668 RepID=UPI00209E43C4|nr:M1-specific T cell receptor alpha chain-like [Lagopus muta]